MVWGCSLSSNLPNCAGSVRCNLARSPCACFLGASKQHEQIVGALFPKGFDQQAAGIIQSAMDHEILGLEQLPEFFQDFGRELRSDAAQIGQFLGQPLHVGFGQSAQDLLGQFFANRDQQDGGLAQSIQLRRFALPAAPL